MIGEVRSRVESLSSSRDAEESKEGSKEGSKEEESNGVRVQRRTRVTVEGDLSADTEYMSWAVDDCKKASYAKRVPKQR